MTWGIIGAAVVTTVGGYIAGSSGRKNASTALGMEQTEFGEQQGFESQLAALIQNPSSVTSTPGYQFTLSQGTEAVARGSAAGGFLNSGNEGAALTQYGQGLATSSLTQQEQLLAGLSGLQASSSSAQNVSATTGASANTFNQVGQLLASLGYVGKGILGSSGTPSTTTPTTGGGQYLDPSWFADSGTGAPAGGYAVPDIGT
jgi:hypothetical protein